MQKTHQTSNDNVQQEETGIILLAAIDETWAGFFGACEEQRKKMKRLYKKTVEQAAIEKEALVLANKNLKGMV